MTGACGWKPPKIFAARPAAPRNPTLKARLGTGYQVASIGPAGERAVRYATISHDGRHAGRGGSGAVLGSKNLKAIAVRGTQRCEWAQPRELAEYSKALSARSFGPATAKYRELGTAANLLTFNRLGVLPTRNFQSGTFEAASSISPEEIRQTHSRTRASCVACTIGCEHIYSLGAEKDEDEGRPPRVREPLRAGPAVRRRRRRRGAPRVADCATTWASTRSAPAAPSPSRWSASNADGSTSRGSRSDPATPCSARSN